MNALILVDLQYDFMPGGALAVTEGDQVVAVANRLMPHFDMVMATQDWHPADHKSFASQHDGKGVGDVIQLDGVDQVLWPDHCVQGTPGASLHEELDTKRIRQIVQKGTNRLWLLTTTSLPDSESQWSTLPSSLLELPEPWHSGHPLAPLDY